MMETVEGVHDLTIKLNSLKKRLGEFHQIGIYSWHTNTGKINSVEIY